MILLDVPFNEKDQVKALGARWNPSLKRWYVQKRTDYYKFLKWMLFKTDNGEVTIVCDHFYIVEGVRTCFKCKKETLVVAFAVDHHAILDYENFYVYDEDNRLDENIDPSYLPLENDFIRSDISLSTSFFPLPKDLDNFLKDKYNYFLDYSKTTKTSYMANHCKFCNCIQGNHFLFDNADSPFWLDSAAAISKLTLYKIPLEYDIAVSTDIISGSTDHLIRSYAKILLLDIQTGSTSSLSKPTANNQQDSCSSFIRLK